MVRLGGCKRPVLDCHEWPVWSIPLLFVDGSPRVAADLGSAAEAGVRSRPGALPELRWRDEDHRGDPGSASDREDPHPSWAAGPGTAPSTSPWAGAASGLSTSQQPSIQQPGNTSCGDRLRPGFWGVAKAAPTSGFTRGKLSRKIRLGRAVNALQVAANPRSHRPTESGALLGRTEARKRVFEFPIQRPRRFGGGVVVRVFHRYYASIRLLVSVNIGRMAIGLPRPARRELLGGH